MNSWFRFFDVTNRLQVTLFDCEHLLLKGPISYLFVVLDKCDFKKNCLEKQWFGADIFLSFFFQLSPNLSHLCHMNKLMIPQIFLVICSRLRIELVLLSTYYFRKVVLCSGMKPEFLEACSWLLVIHTL